MKTYIYALKDPLTDQIRYVGKTNNLKRRLKAHCNPARFKQTHKFNWIKKLRDQGLKPNIEVLEEVDTSRWKDRERWWISHFKEEGVDLTNCGVGGEGLSFGNQTSFKKGHKLFLGRRHSEETRKKISENNYLKGKPSVKRKPVVQMDLDGNVIARFDFIHQAAKETGSLATKIVACCKGKRNKHNNSKWKYE